MRMGDLKDTLVSFVVPMRDDIIKKRFAVMIHGPSGIGKTETVEAMATELDMACVTIHMSELEPGDATGYPRVKVVRGEEVSYHAIPEYLPRYLKDEEGNVAYRADGMPALDIEALGDIVANMDELREKFGKDVNLRVKGVIILLDELNRIADLQMMQSVFQLPGSHRMHTYRLPKGCCVIACVNPNNENYQVNDMDSEKAFARRWLHLRAEPHIDDSLSWAQKKDICYEVTSFYSADPTALCENEEYTELPVRRTPAAIPLLHTLLKDVQLPEKDSIRREVFIGVLGEEYGGNFVNHLRDQLSKILSAEDVLFNYPKTRDRMMAKIDEGDLGFITMVVRNIVIYMREEENAKRVRPGHELTNLEAFVADLPKDYRVSFVSDLVNYDHINEILSYSDPIFEIIDGDTEHALSID